VVVEVIRGEGRGERKEKRGIQKAEVIGSVIMVIRAERVVLGRGSSDPLPVLTIRKQIIKECTTKKPIPGRKDSLTQYRSNVGICWANMGTFWANTFPPPAR
jgi:hypothetical protein